MRRAAAWTAWYRERRAAGDEAVTKHGLAIAVMLRHREDPPGYVTLEPEVEPVVEPVVAPIIDDDPDGLPEDFWETANWRTLHHGPPQMAAE